MSDITTNATQRYDSADAAAGVSTEDERHSIATYLGDMLALERHMRPPLDRQVNDADTAKFSEALAIATKLRSLVDAHEAALDVRLQAVGGDGAAGVKSAWSGLLGAGAAAINATRSTKVSKAIRDDYTALALATISYTMLHATALGLGDETTAALAKQHLDDYAPIVIEISNAIPAIVLEELRADGENVRVSAAQIAQQNQSQSWSEAS
jgi:ferritin-like metal-binding protein YciE